MTKFDDAVEERIQLALESIDEVKPLVWRLWRVDGMCLIKDFECCIRGEKVAKIAVEMVDFIRCSRKSTMLDYKTRRKR